MENNKKAQIAQVLGCTLEAHGQQFTPAGLAVMCGDLIEYDINSIKQALLRCRRELTRRITISDVIERIEFEDGRPDPNEAWNLALQASDESDSVVWNDEIAQAWGSCSEIMNRGDQVGARMAFIEKYKKVTYFAREQKQQPKWYASLGSDKSARVAAIDNAVRLGRLTTNQADNLLPDLRDPAPTIGLDRLISGVVDHDAKISGSNKEAAKQSLSEIKDMFKCSQTKRKKKDDK